MAEPIKIGGQWLDPMTGQPVSGMRTTDEDWVQMLMAGQSVPPEVLQRLGLPGDYAAARQIVMQNNEASGKESGLIGAMSGVMESPLAPFLLGGAFLGMGGAFSGLGGAGSTGSGMYSGGGLSAELAAGAPELSGAYGMGGAAPNVWQSVADMGPLAGPTQAPGYTMGDYGMGEFAGYPGQSYTATDLWGADGALLDAGSSGGATGGNYAPVVDRSLGAYSAANTADSSIMRGLGQVGQGLFGGGGGSSPWLNLAGQGLNAYMGYKGATNAADAMRDVAGQNQAALAPWLQAGTGALNTLSGRMPELTRRFTMSDFEQDPGYAFRLAEGQKAIERSAAAKGGLFSGGTGKALTRYGQDMGSQEYTNAYNRYMGGNQNEYNMYSNLAGLGQTATGQLINQNTQLGNVNAATEMAKANALTGGVNNFLNSQNRYSIYDNIFRPGGG